MAHRTRKGIDQERVRLSVSLMWKYFFHSHLSPLTMFVEDCCHQCPNRLFSKAAAAVALTAINSISDGFVGLLLKNCERRGVCLGGAEWSCIWSALVLVMAGREEVEEDDEEEEVA